MAGPTASGKSLLGIKLAQQFAGEVLACDSTQLYRGFDIGTAKPFSAERNGVTHHLLDVLDAMQPATAGGYRQMALAVLADLRQRNRLPILTVGTGLYLRALLEGLADSPQRSEELRERLRANTAKHSPGHLHRVLQKLDPSTAARIDARDEQKLIRAVEVCLLAKRPLSQVHDAGRAPLQGWRVLKIGLDPPREALYQRIHSRTDEMLASGWVDEVRSLLDSGIAENAKPFDFIGYREIRAVVRGEMSVEAARSAIQSATRHYAKRQLTWFRKDADVRWFKGFGDEPQVQRDILMWLQERGVSEVRATESPSV
ncbi:MAG TPA: tRNA (adenosine(37)-N6)-dimethylallyltransferase MiaA [Candidatus Acidoferrum sp.]